MSIIGKSASGKKVIIGLSDRNLEHLRAGRPFHKFAEEAGLPFDIIIFHKKTEDELIQTVRDLSSPETTVHDHRGEKKQ